MKVRPTCLRDRLVIIDQMVSSASNALPVLMVARTASVSEFGMLSILVAGIIFLLTWFRTTFGEATLGQLWTQRGGDFYRIIAEIALLSFVGGCAVGLIYHMFGGVTWLAMISAFGAPIVVVQDQLRLRRIQQRRFMRALVSDSSWLVGSLVFQFVVALFGGDSALMFAGWLFGALIALLVLTVGTPTPKSARFSIKFFETSPMLQIGLANLAAASASFAIVPISLIAAGPVATGYLRLAYLALTPAAFVTTLTAPLILPRLVRGSGLTTVWETVQRLVGATFGVAMLSLVLVMMFASAVWPNVKGNSLQWASLVVGIQCCVVIVSAILYLETRVAGDEDAYRRARLSFSLSSAIGVGLGGIFLGLPGVLLGALSGSIVELMILGKNYKHRLDHDIDEQDSRQRRGTRYGQVLSFVKVNRMVRPIKSK